MRSIRQQIYLGLTIALLLVIGISVKLLSGHIKVEIEELFDAEMAQMARVIESLATKHLSLTATEILTTHVPNINREQDQQGHQYEKKLAFQVWDQWGNLRIMSENAPLYPLSAKSPGFSHIEFQGQYWHVFTLYVPSDDLWIHTAQRNDIREELAELMVLNQLWPLSIICLLVGLAVFAIVHFGLQPLKRLSNHLSQLEFKRLTSVPASQVTELYPIEQALNQAISRFQETLDRERRFSADAAHELRTPLAGLKIHAQNIENSADVSKENQQSIAKLILGVDRMANSVEQLLQLSKIEGQQERYQFSCVALSQVAKECITELPISIITEHDISLEADDSEVQGNADLLQCLLRNLISNSAKYSAKGTAIEVTIASQHDSVELAVRDYGAGMSTEMMAKACQPFYRGVSSEVSGAGLGLSIVDKIVSLHQARLHFARPKDGVGLLVQVTFQK